MMQTAIANTLPQKEANLLKKLFKFYETKQYKKGIKSADEILDKFPDHPETKSLKGLFLYHSGDKDKGLALAKEALAKNFKSELCWHILGIINRSQRKYKDAIGCYKNALKYDPENLNILRDLAVLQVHVRELDLHAETRKTLLRTKSNLPVNWVALAVAEHLLGNHDETLKVLDSFRKVVKEDELKPYEKSELILYEVLVMIEMKNEKEAVKYLEKHDKSIVDRTAFNEYFIKAYLALNEPEKALPYVRALFEKYPENLRIVNFWQECKGIGQATNENRQKIVDLHNEILKDFPKSQAVKRNLIRYLQGEEFRQKFDEYLRPFYIKGQPSVFNDIQELLKDAEKAKIIEEVALSHHKSLSEKATFAGSETVESPCCLLWSYLFLGELFNWKGEYAKAIEYIDQAIEHTPTLIELYQIKAKIYKNNFNFKLAAEAAEKARQMDLADRYPNNLAVKYMIRNNDLEKGDTLLKSFIRDSSDANIHELQYMWYEYELGNAHLRSKEFGPAFRQFKFIEKHFQDFYEDQFDFHTYCLRKYDLRAYLNFVRKEDRIHNNKWFIKATVSMIKGLEAYEQHLPEIKKAEEEEKKKMEEMDTHERKRYKKEKEAKEAEAAGGELDLKGKKLLEELKNPIDEACNFARQLLSCNIEKRKHRVAVFTQICLLYLRKGKPLVALKAYNKVAGLVNEEADVHLTRLSLIEELEKIVSSETLDAEVRPIIEEELNAIKAESDMKKLHETFKSTVAKNLINEIKGVEGDVILRLIKKEDAVKLLEGLIAKYKDTARIKEAVYAFNQIKDTYGASEEIIKKIQALLKDRFALSPIFNPEALNAQALKDLPTPNLISS